MFRASHGEGTRSSELSCLSKCATLPESLHVHQSGSTPNPILLGFRGGFVTKTQFLKSLAFEGVLTCDHMVDSLGYQPSSLGVVQKLPRSRTRKTFVSQHLGHFKAFSTLDFSQKAEK